MFSAPPKASYEFCFRRLVKFLGIAAPTDPTGDTLISTSPYTADLLKKQICQSDYEVQALIASVENQTYRPTYFTEDPVTVLHDAKIDGYIGIHGGVSIDRTRSFTANVTEQIGTGTHVVGVSGSPFVALDVGSLLIVIDGDIATVISAIILSVENADGVTIAGDITEITTHGSCAVTVTRTEKGRLASSHDALMRARQNFAFYGSPVDLYYIDNATALLANPDAFTSLKVNLPELVPADPDDSPPELGSPQAYQNGVVAHAIATLLPTGVDAGHRQQWSGIWMNYAQLILGNSSSLPDPERFQRIAA